MNQALTAARFSELVFARSEELVDGVWTISRERAKNGIEHRIPLGPWGTALLTVSGEWIFPADRVEGPRTQGWYEARDRIIERMSKKAGRPVAHFTPHDFRRTARSNTKRLKFDYEIAEAMMNHVKTGLSKTYDLYELEDEKREWFNAWEAEIAGLAVRARVARELGVPNCYDARATISMECNDVRWPSESTRGQSRFA